MRDQDQNLKKDTTVERSNGLMYNAMKSMVRNFPRPQDSRHGFEINSALALERLVETGKHRDKIHVVRTSLKLTDNVCTHQ